MFQHELFFELSCKNTHTDPDEYSIVTFCKNATIINTKLSNQTALILRFTLHMRTQAHTFFCSKYT